MPYKRKVFYFFRCPECLTWHYSDHRLKTKKYCNKCNKDFKFEDSIKLKRKRLTTKQAIAYIKELKKPDMRELIQFATIPEEVDH